MSLTKCTECGGEISDQALACPHCGKPVKSEPVIATPIIQELQAKSHFFRNSVALFILLLFIGGYFLFQNQQKNYSGQGTFIGEITQNLHNGNYSQVLNDLVGQQGVQNSINANRVPLQEVNNLGYDFYVGEIESSGVTNINDGLKNQITKIAYDAKFPKSILAKTPIIIVNNLALKPDQYIEFSGARMKIISFGPDFLYEGGVNAGYESGRNVIYINKASLNNLADVLTHELGHSTGDTLTDSDWKKFYSLRNIPTSTPREGGLWNMSPSEDFAEVYKYVFTGLDVRTSYGSFTQDPYEKLRCENEKTAAQIRQDIFALSEETGSSSPTTSTCNLADSNMEQKIKDFVNSVMERLNN